MKPTPCRQYHEGAGLNLYTLIQTAKLNEVDPQAWLADVLTRIADIPQTRLSDLLPWSWRPILPIRTAA